MFLFYAGTYYFQFHILQLHWAVFHNVCYYILLQSTYYLEGDSGHPVFETQFGKYH